MASGEEPAGLFITFIINIGRNRARGGQVNSRERFFIGKQQKHLHSLWSSLPGASPLRREGEDHPTDDEVEKENGIDDQSFAVWGLAVCQEGRRGWEKKQGRPHVGKTGTRNITHQITPASRPYTQKPWLLASPRLFPPQGAVQADAWIWSGSGPGGLAQTGQEGRGGEQKGIPPIGHGSMDERLVSSQCARKESWAHLEYSLTMRIPD